MENLDKNKNYFTKAKPGKKTSLLTTANKVQLKQAPAPVIASGLESKSMPTLQ